MTCLDSCQVAVAGCRIMYVYDLPQCSHRVADHYPMYIFSRNSCSSTFYLFIIIYWWKRWSSTVCLKKWVRVTIFKDFTKILNGANFIALKDFFSKTISKIRESNGPWKVRIICLWVTYANVVKLITQVSIMHPTGSILIKIFILFICKRMQS